VALVSVPAQAGKGERVIFRAAGAGVDLSAAFQVTDALPPYTVRAGDSIESIAAWFGVYPGDLKLDNLDTREFGLVAGRKLLIPERRDRSIPLPRATQASSQILAQAIGAGERWVDVNLTRQQVNVYTGARLEKQFVASTGVRKHPTLPGNFKVYLKYPKANMGGPGYYLVNVPDILYYDRGYALHGTYWHDNFGVPMSHGCINLSEADADWLFDFLPLGALVMIHE
jgi:LysM repeat protein